MKIKAKLLTLIISMLAAMTISIAIYIGFNIFTKKINMEEAILQTYRSTLQESHTELFRFLLDSFVIVDQLELFNKSIEEKTAVFNKIEHIKYLPSIHEETKFALKNIANLEEYQADGLRKFYKSTEDLLESVKEVMGSDRKFVLNSLSSSSGGLDSKQLSKLRFFIKRMKKELYYIEVGIQTSVDIIDDQYAIIDAQIMAFEQLGIKISLGLFFVVLILSILIASITSGKIVKSISEIGTSLSIMAKGDLSHDINIKSSDEIGTLSKDMNKFQYELNNSLEKIKRHSIKNEEVKNYLINTATEASAASEEIAANITSVDNQMNTLNSNILQANSQVNQISSFTTDLNNHIADQMAMVEESTASITEMIASIASVSNLTDKNMTIVEELQVTAKNGDSQIAETTDIIEDINSSIHNIGAMAEVIQNISDQTNLLAMNAAIEAAHAGDAGKGFAVVADEIRKLSEASALSSKDIGKNLKEIMKKFEKASISGVNTKDAFGNIYENIKGVTEALLAVSSSTSELNIGGTQILEAMDNLSKISNEVQTKSGDMSQSAESVKESIGQVSQISSIVTEAMTEVNIGFSGVKDSITGLEKISTQVGNVSKDINAEVNKFKTVNNLKKNIKNAVNNEEIV